MLTATPSKSSSSTSRTVAFGDSEDGWVLDRFFDMYVRLSQVCAEQMTALVRYILQLADPAVPIQAQAIETLKVAKSKQQLMDTARPQFSKEAMQYIKHYKETKVDEVETLRKLLSTNSQHLSEFEIDDRVNEKGRKP